MSDDQDFVVLRDFRSDGSAVEVYSSHSRQRCLEFARKYALENKCELEIIYLKDSLPPQRIGADGDPRWQCADCEAYFLRYEDIPEEYRDIAEYIIPCEGCGKLVCSGCFSALHYEIVEDDEPFGRGYCEGFICNRVEGDDPRDAIEP